MGKERSRCAFETNGGGLGKVIFATADDADSVERFNRQMYKSEKQYVYPCPHADHFHLTSRAQESVSPYASSSSKLGEIAKFKNVTCVNSHEENKQVAATSPRRTRRTWSLEQKVEILSKIDSGSTAMSICRQYDVDKCLVSYWRKQPEVIVLLAKGTKPATTTIADCESAEQKLEQELEAVRLKMERELAAIRVKKQTLIEAKRVKIAQVGANVSVTKEGNTVTFTGDEWNEFLEQAMSFSVAGAAAAAAGK